MNLKFSFSPRSSQGGGAQQQIGFFYAYGALVGDGAPQKNNSYSSLLNEGNGILFLNYNIEGDYKSPVGVSISSSKSYAKMSIYKREIWDGGGEQITKPVVIEGGSAVFYDFNISNGRTYEYTILPSSQQINTVVKQAIKTNWGFWSITELHPVSGESGKYTASAEDVWIFKYNVEPGEQTQNIYKTKQDNLFYYPRFSVGAPNYVSGNISCLLGSEILPYNFVSTSSEPVYSPDYTLAWEEKPNPHVEGGYVEKLRYAARLTSNQKIDMLNAWRKISYSPNPKLLKDMKGQKFLVQITESSNTPNQNWKSIPDVISFSWTQIGDADEITVTNDYFSESTENA